MPALPLAQTDTPDPHVVRMPAPTADNTPPPPVPPAPSQPAVPTAAPTPPTPAPATQDQPTDQAAPAQPQLPPPSATPGPQKGAIQTEAQSEHTPTVVKPPLDPRPYASLAEHAPQYRELVDKIADETGVSPQRLAWHWYKEGGFKTDVPNGAAGEEGPLQMMPDTSKEYNKNGVLDPKHLHDALLLAGRHINELDAKFGKDSPSSVGAYQGGPGSVTDIASNPGDAAKNHPRTLAYAASAFPGAQVGPTSFTGQGNMDAKGLVNAANQGGPDGFLRYVTQTAPAGLGMTDAMRQAEATLVGFAASRGDFAGMQHARDFTLQLAHAGANQNLMAAHQALSNGDSQGAAEYLAKAHAFFPDSTMGQFGVDSKGQLWASRVDEHDPTRAIGAPQPITPQAIRAMLNQTTDPGKFLATVQAEQKNAADIRHQDAMGSYYGNLLSSREKIADQNNQTRKDVGAGHDDARVTSSENAAQSRENAAAIRAQARQGQGPSASLSKQADKEADNYFSDLAMPEKDDRSRGQMAEVYHDLRMGGTTPPQSVAVTKGIASGSLRLVKQTNGDYGVVDPKDPRQQAITYISAGLGDRLAGSKAPTQQQGIQTTPVGAGAATPTARATGMTSNMSGTVNPATSSALPVGPAQ